jgi:hypothetical protein
MNEIKSLGQVAFEAYRAEVVTAFNGDPIPEWDKLDNGAPARRGWEAAAQAVREHVRMIDALPTEFEVSTWRSVPSRWQPIGNPPPAAPIGGFIPAGHGEPPTGKTVPVDVEDDSDRG